MSEAPKHPPLADVLATARTVVNHKTSRGAISVPVSHILGMAHALCALADIATSAAEMLAAAERSYQAAQGDDIDAEVAAVEAIGPHENELIEGLMALGFLTFTTQDTNDERAD
ncbi:hypothetical protein [Ancylobacter pratisalsi]|uniref:Uncharacterized protein n=1 Tax=Ancylobacter pratisalsi TaxID=1745854 RepID=A0A6P1YN24_9HYPH|nr:hypothetical protein [Ancylobacter pratisalsi]QIB34778.1 hypothetical protein G3A50_14470 [Ancylobacter pratisalsi]